MAENKKLLNAYIYDFLLKSSLDETAQLFKQEADLPDTKPEMDAPQGFLYEWWQIFWDIFNARTHRGGSNLAEKYFQMQLYKQRQENSYRGMAMRAAVQSQQAEQHGEFDQEGFDPMTFSMMMADTQNTMMQGMGNNAQVPTGMVSGGASFSNAGAVPHSMQQQQPNLVAQPATGPIDTMGQQQPMGPVPQNARIPTPYYDQRTSPPHKMMAAAMAPMVGGMMSNPDQQLDAQSPLLRQSQQQTPNSNLSPPAPLNAPQQIHGGPMFQNQPPIYPYNVAGNIYPMQQNSMAQQYVQSPIMAMPTSSTSGFAGVPTEAANMGSSTLQRKRKKQQASHAAQAGTQQMMQTSNSQNQNVEKQFTSAHALHNYRRQLMVLERENKKAISSIPTEGRSAGNTPLANSHVAAHHFSNNMLPPSAMISPQTQGSPLSLELGNQGVTKERKYSRRKTDQSKKSLSEPNSPATPLTPFTGNNLTLSSTLSTVTEVPHHEAAFSPRSLNEEEKKRTYSKPPISAHSASPISTESLIDTTSSSVRKGFVPVTAQTVAVPVSLSSTKNRTGGRKTPGSSGSSNGKKSSVSSISITNSLNPMSALAATSNLNTVSTADSLLAGDTLVGDPIVPNVLPISNSGNDFSPVNQTADIDGLQNAPTLSGEVSFHFDQDDPDLLSNVKKTTETATDYVHDLSNANTESNDSELLNEKGQSTFNLDFSDPNSTYNDFNFFQFSWR
ncbi:HDL293Cp [Eremothecium sinecaudum]|uniref:HDL293Cp n=1 Tax=Eremothecium sinecaudum TaxID=45286 RepID=A0A0X8HS54_9SACH|nr:HDL293Cp [Eremothecium sinecaudum]AMD20451.1 HDL293Cp [Eremothecium sinecaudum]